jgi:Got1/Sft2-like family
MSRNFADFASTLSFYSGAQGSDSGGGSSSIFSQNTPPKEEQSKGLMGWASNSFSSLSDQANDLMMTKQRLATFALLLGGGAFCMLMSLASLPFIAIAPQRFSSMFTFGSLLILGSFSTLKGHKAFISHLISKERLPFTLGYSVSLLGSLYANLVSKEYLLTLIFCVIQIIALAYFLISYFPGGATALNYLGGGVVSAIKNCIKGRTPLLPI